MSMQRWFAIALSPRVIRRAVKVSLVVGSLLVVINHAPALWQGDLSRFRLFQIGLTYVVPYCVATWSSVAAWLDRDSPTSPEHQSKPSESQATGLDPE